MPVAAARLIRMKADTFRATLRLGLGFKGPIHVPEELRIRDTGITQLCDTLCVDGDLDLTGCTNLETLPSRLIVRGELTIDRCSKITALPSTVREVFGFSAEGCDQLVSIDPIVECRGPLNVAGCKALAPLPPTFRAKDQVQLTGCLVTATSTTLDAEVPETIMTGLPGRRLGALLDHAVLAMHPIRDAIITGARWNRYTGKTDLDIDGSALICG